MRLGLASAISEVEPLSRHLDQVAQRMTMAQAVASREEIAQCLTLLIAAYPNASIKGDLTTFGRMLVEDVASLEPSVAAVDKACRELRQTKTFVPAIAEVIAAVRFAEKRLAVCLQLLDALPEQLAEARGTLEHLERTEAARAEHMKRMRDREESRRTDVPIAERLKELRVRLRLRMDVRTGEFPRRAGRAGNSGMGASEWKAICADLSPSRSVHPQSALRSGANDEEAASSRARGRT
jgi:cell division protein FtsB